MLLGRLSNGAPVYGPDDADEQAALYAQIVGLEERYNLQSPIARIAFYGLGQGADLPLDERLEKLLRVEERMEVTA